jgi:serine/threonine protein kinase/WD40 repeat protein
VKTVNVIEAVFFAALDKKDASERAAYLDQACSGDPDLRRCVDKLLAAQPKVGEFLQAPAPGLPAADANATTDHATDARPGTILGPYKLLHEIGEGGMGTVWMAEQTEPVRRRVALKVIKPGMDSRQVLARFEAERQALALMDHPNIAKVLDAGATENGRPYFVMELVKGQPITEFCDKNLLTTRERLDLFVCVCNAIQHAHQKGVIHRDVKPSNVLVALYDGKPVPKVIDFGVAKAVGDPLTDKTLFTRHGQVVGTFEYMSPEQANLDQIDIDTRSDVYALGVLLYELLTGTTPLDKERLRQAGLAEVLRLIREEEPPTPSTRLTSSPGLLATAAAYRKTDSQKLPRAVRGELDWIVMKALDKDRNRRFPTANGLAADVERFLKGEPVQACPPTLSYRFRKYARKHRVALAAGGAIAAALLVGISLTSWQAVRATSAERAAARDRDAAVAAGQETADERDKTMAALTRLELNQKEMRANQYAWDIQTLQHIWDAGNVTEARGMVARQIPRAGEPDLRSFEWYYWNRQTHPEISTGVLPVPPEFASTRPVDFADSADREWFFSADGRRVAHCVSLPTVNQGVKIALMVWDVATRTLLRTRVIPPEPNDGDSEFFRLDSGTSMSRDGKRVLLAGRYGSHLRIDRDAGAGRRPAASRHLILAWDVDSDQVLFDLRKVPNIERLQFFSVSQLSPDGRRFVTALGVDQRNPADRPADRPAFAGSKVWDLDAADKEPVTIDGNLASATLVSFSPDGARFVGDVIVDGKDTNRLWDTATGKELHRWDFSGTFVFSPGDGARLGGTVLEDVDETRVKRVLKVLDARTGKQVSSVTLPGLFTRTNSEVLSLRIAAATNAVFSPDGSLLVVPHSPPTGPVGGRRQRRVDLYFVKSDSDEIVRTLEDPVSSQPGRGEIVRTLEDPVSSQPSRLVRNIPYRRDPRFFSGDGKQFICRVDNVFHTFDVKTGRPVNTLRGHVNGIMAAVATGDGRHLFSLESDGVLKQWDLRSTEPVRIATDERSPTLAVSDDGAWVAWVHTTGAEQRTTVQVGDTGGKEVITLKARPRNGAGPDERTLATVLLSADGKRVALIRTSLGRGGQPKPDPATLPVPPDVTVWDVASRTELFHTALFHAVLARTDGVEGFIQCTLSPDGTTFAFVRQSSDEAKNRRSMLRVFDVDSRRARPEIAVAGRAIGPRFSPDGRRVLSMVQVSNPDGGIVLHAAVWDLARGTQVFSVDVGGARASVTGGPYPFENTGNVTPLWTPDGTRVALIEVAKPQCRFLDAATGTVVKTVPLSPRGGTLGSRNPRGGPRAPFGRNFTIAFSPDGRRIACQSKMRSGDLMVSILDADSGKELLSLPFQATGRPFDLTLKFSSDGHLLRHFDPKVVQSGAPDPPNGRPLGRTQVVVTTWDVTPLPELKQP